MIDGMNALYVFSSILFNYICHVYSWVFPRSCDKYFLQSIRDKNYNTNILHTKSQFINIIFLTKYALVLIT